MEYLEYVRIGDTFRQSRRYWAAQINYKKAVELWKLVADREMQHDKKKQHYDEMSSIIDLIQSLDVNFDFNKFKDNGNIVETIVVPEKNRTFNYGSIFEKYCNEEVKEIVLYESDVYLRAHTRYIRMLLRSIRDKCPNLKLVMLKCQKMNGPAQTAQALLLQQFQKELEQSNLSLAIDMILHKHFTQTKIVFSNGFVFLFDKGLCEFTYTNPNDTLFLPPISGNRAEVWFTNVFNNDAMGIKD